MSTAPKQPADSFWDVPPKTAEQLAIEQGIAPVTDLEELMGSGTDMWADDAEFEAFLEWLYRSRRAGHYGPHDSP